MTDFSAVSGGSADRAASPLNPAVRFTISLALGAVTVTGFAPIQAHLVPFVTFAGLFLLLNRGLSPRTGALTGFCFGLGLFGVGVSWIFLSLQRYSALPDALSVAATVLLCAYFALYPAIFGFFASRFRTSANAFLLLPCLWTATEIARGALLGGFSWLSLGYSQTPNSVLGGYAPLIGQYGVSFMVTLLGSCLAVFVFQDRIRIIAALLATSVLAVGWSLQAVQWTEPHGQPLSVSLLQGNVPQDRKWDRSELDNTFKTYLQLTRQASSRLIVLPETALSLPSDDLPMAYRYAFLSAAQKNKADIVVGAPERLMTANEVRYYNSAQIWGSSAVQTYRKARLVPFGEFVPRVPFIEPIVTALSIPLSNLSAGAVDQGPLLAGGARLAVNICFENIFGEATARSAVDAEAIVNISNLAWFGQSLAPAQFLQMAQMRAQETGRYVMLATNTGPTAVVNHLGRIQAQAPEFKIALLESNFVRRIGATPYSRAGDTSILLLLTAIFLCLISSRINTPRSR